MKNFFRFLFRFFLVVIFAVILFVAGFMVGKQHTITDSIISLHGNSVYIEIDNNTYVHNVK